MFMEGKPNQVPISPELLLKRREEAEVTYKKIGSVHCPYFNDKIHFNAKGLEHLKFKSRGKARSSFDQFTRFKLLHLAPTVLGKSHTLQGIWETNLWESQKRYGQWEKRLRPVSYYEFVAVVGKVRVKKIVKRIEGGELHFWSLIPFWRMNEVTNKRQLYDGDPEME